MPDYWDDVEPDDWYDDMPEQHVKEEPDCGACYDSGVTWTGKRCRSCRPTWLEARWYALKWRYQARRFRRRTGGSTYDEEAPF